AERANVGCRDAGTEREVEQAQTQATGVSDANPARGVSRRQQRSAVDARYIQHAQADVTDEPGELEAAPRVASIGLFELARYLVASVVALLQAAGDLETTRTEAALLVLLGQLLRGRLAGVGAPRLFF